MTHRLDAVPVGIEDKRAVVVGVIMFAQAGRAVVLADCGQRGLIKRVHLLAVVGDERDVHRLLRSLALSG
jgi:hypothetical protein